MPQHNRLDAFSADDIWLEAIGAQLDKHKKVKNCCCPQGIFLPLLS
jgi:hypothetical protein